MKEWFTLKKKMFKKIVDLEHILLFHKVVFRTLLSVSCQVSAKLGTCTVAGLNGTLVENVHIHPRIYVYYL
jgi:hypothetical protein